jgi:tetratricopeptide (TPR) repeat protein
MRLRTCAAAVGAAVIAAAHSYGSLRAQTQQQVDACEGKGNLPLDTVISGCTALIQSGNYRGRDLSTVFVTRATAYQREGQLERAIQDYDEAIRLDPSSATAYYNRGVAYGTKGDWDRAIEDYNQALRHHPNDAAAFRSRGLAYQEKKQPDRAIQDFDQAVRLDPNDATAFAYLNRPGFVGGSNS